MDLRRGAVAQGNSGTDKVPGADECYSLPGCLNKVAVLLVQSIAQAYLDRESAVSELSGMGMNINAKTTIKNTNREHVYP
jgi:hypothetical protein